MTVPGLKTRKPTGRAPWPCILLEGEPKAGKSYAAAQLSASDKIGATYWLDLGEGAADEYGVLPGARYEVIEHDGSYGSILAAVQAVKAEAERAAAAGEPPTVLVIDTLSAVWDLLKDWTAGRARKARVNQARLREDPNAELTISQNLWNDAGARWAAITTPLLTFPGIVVAIARGKEVVAMDDNGRPIEGKKEWRVEVRKNWEYSPSVWVRMQREAGATVIGARSVTAGLVPGKDRVQPVTDRKADGRLLEWLVFDAMGIDPSTAAVRDLRDLHGGELAAHERALPEAGEERPAAQRPDRPAPAAATGQPQAARSGPWYLAEIGKREDEGLRELWKLAHADGVLTRDVEDQSGESLTIEERITARVEFLREKARLDAAAAPTRAAEAAVRAAGAPPADPMTAATEAAAAALGATPIEGEVLDPAGEQLPAQPDPEDLCRNTAQRRAVLAQLAEQLGGNDKRDAAIGREFRGLAEGQVATKRLREWLTELQKAGA